MEGPARLEEAGLESFMGSDLASKAKLLLVEGVEAEELGFFLGVGFLLCLFQEVTLVNPSASALPSASVLRAWTVKGQSQKRCPWA